MAKYARIKVNDFEDREYNVKLPVSLLGDTAITDNTLDAALLPRLKTINNNYLVGTGNISIENGISEKIAAKSIVAQYQYQNIGINKASDREVDIMIFAGQSNSCGRAQLSDAENLGYLADIAIEKGWTYQFSSTASEHIKRKIVEPISANGSSGYGYIPLLIDSYYEATHRKVCACFKSAGGTMMHSWLPYSFDKTTGEIIPTPTTYYTQMVTSVQAAKQYLAEDGYTVGHIFLIWMQGESDAEYYGYENSYANKIEETLVTIPEQQAYYKEHFSNLVARLKEDVGLTKCGIIRIGHRNRQNDILYNSIIGAQNQLGQENDDIAVISTILAGIKVYEYPNGQTKNLMRDTWHFLLEGYCYTGIEAGLNLGLYVNSEFICKPVLYEYNNDYLKSISQYIPVPGDSVLDSYLYFPKPHSLTDFKKYGIFKTTAIAISPTSYTGALGSTVQLKVEYTPENATDKGVVWMTSDPEIAIVSDSGLVTCLKEGSCAITAALAVDDSIYSTIEVVVNNTAVPVTDIVLNTSEISTFVNKTYQLTATVLPEDATNKAVTWFSSEPMVASVSETGLVTALDVGEVTITCMSVQYPLITATCSVFIDTQPETLLDLDFTKNTLIDYVNNGILVPPASVSYEGITYDEEGLHTADGALDRGMILADPINNAETEPLKITLVAKAAPFATSGTTRPWSQYANFMILTSDLGTTNSSRFQPGIYFQPSSASDSANPNAGFVIRPTETSTTSYNSGANSCYDDTFHTYVLELSGTTMTFYRDGVLKRTLTSPVRTGSFKYVFGTIPEYTYYTQFNMSTGWVIQSLKVESL